LFYIYKNSENMTHLQSIIENAWQNRELLKEEATQNAKRSGKLTRYGNTSSG
jgi:hypothetical protein